MEDRYSRNMPALTQEECAQLKGKRVCVVGCGGLGGYIIELLARVGVGALTVVDGDVFEPSNLNRQILSEEAYIGYKKAEIAARRVAAINRDVIVDARAEYFTKSSAHRLLRGCDLAMDALDSIEGRLLLAEACTDQWITLVHGAISGFYAQVSVVAPGSGLIEKLYPHRTTEGPARGNLGFTASVCASIQTTEAVKLLCGRQSALLGTLMLIDMRTMEFSKIDIS